MLIDGATVDLEQDQRLRAELQAQTQELRGSRARLVAVGDAERRRLERDLHDGAQSRFAGVALQLRLAQRTAPADSELARTLETAIGELSTGETAAYFAVSEALANVVKHAGAGTRVHVEIPLARPALSSPCRRFLRGG